MTKKIFRSILIAAAAVLVLVLLGLGFWLKDRLNRDIIMDRIGWGSSF